MAININRHIGLSYAAIFTENMRRLVDVVNSRLENVMGENCSRESLLLDRGNLRHMRHAYLICRACQLMGEAGSVTMRELSMGLLKKNYTCARLANWMSDRGLVERDRDSKDRRVVRIWLTSEGWQLREAMNEVLSQEIDSL